MLSQRHIRPLAALVVALLAMGLGAGCMKLERDPLERRFYNLDVERAGDCGPVLADKNLKVRRAKVSPLFDGRAIVYRARSGEFQSDYYNEYFVAPADIVTQAVRQWVSGAGVYDQVVSPSSLLRSEHVLETNVVTLYGDYHSAPPLAVLEVQFLLLDEMSEEHAVLLAKTYQRSIPVQSASAQAVTNGLEQGLTEVLGEFEQDLRQTLAALPEETGSPDH